MKTPRTEVHAPAGSRPNLYQPRVNYTCTPGTVVSWGGMTLVVIRAYADNYDHSHGGYLHLCRGLYPSEFGMQAGVDRVAV